MVDKKNILMLVLPIQNALSQPFGGVASVFISNKGNKEGTGKSPVFLCPRKTQHVAPGTWYYEAPAVVETPKARCCFRFFSPDRSRSYKQKYAAFSSLNL